MYPEQPSTPPQPPVQSPDYLNQIAPEAPRTMPFKFGPKLLIIAAAILVVLIIIVSITVNVIVEAQRQPLQQLAARLTTTETIANDAQPNLKSSQLRSLNSNLKIYLTNTNRDIGQPLSSGGVNAATLPESILTKESGNALSTTLEDARLNAVFDRTYAREMTYVLGNTLALMIQIRSSTGSTELRSFLDSAIADLTLIHESFSDFDAAGN
jgi:hypothetical protein